MSDINTSKLIYPERPGVVNTVGLSKIMTDQIIRGDGVLQLPANLSTGLYILMINDSKGLVASGKVVVR